MQRRIYCLRMAVVVSGFSMKIINKFKIEDLVIFIDFINFLY